MNKITINQELAVRLLLCSLALFNAVADMLGWPHLELSNEVATQFMNVIFLVIGYIWGFWKNNNFTKAAKESQKVLNILKENPQADIEVNINDSHS